jgi:arrestin (S-antigen)-like protein
MFMAGSDVLARVDFSGQDRPLLLQIEKGLSPRKRVVRLFTEQDNYAPGEIVRGHVEVDWPKAAPVRGVRVGLYGTEEAEVTVTRGSGNDRTSTTYREVETQVAEEWILFGGDRIGWGQAAAEALRAIFRKQDYPELAAGRHRFPFEFALPDDALPTFRGDHATVDYRLYAVVDIPLGFDQVFNGSLTVVESRQANVVPGTHVGDQTAEGLFKSLSADLRMGFQISRVPYHYGESLKARLRVENRSKKRIKAARISLSSVEHARAGGYDRDTRTDLRKFTVNFSDPGAESHDYDFDIPIPAWPVPFAGRYSRVDLWLSATLVVARGFNATIEVPLEIE